MLYSQTLGFYLPSFFYLWIGDNKKTYDLNKMEDHDLSVFFHEYMHFIQDLTTFHGINRAYCVNEYVKAILKNIYADRANVKAPIPYTSIDDKVKLELDIMSKESGKIDNIDNFDVYAYEVKTVTAGVVGTIFDVKVATITDTTGRTVDFGGTTIAESMAYLLQRICTKIDYTSPDSPYCLAEKIAKAVCPKVFTDDINTIALCDASLMSSAPGVVFLHVLDECSKRPDDFPTPESIIDFTLALEGVDAESKSVVKLREFYRSKAVQVAVFLKDYIQVTTHEFEVNIGKCFNLAMEYRKSNPYFMIEIVRGGYLKTNKAFLQLITDFGGPLIGNAEGQYYQCPSVKFDNTFMTYFLAIREILRLLESGHAPCGLKPWCKNSLGAPADDRCDKSPWLHCGDSQLCPYGLLWRNWNLKGWMPV